MKHRGLFAQPRENDKLTPGRFPSLREWRWFWFPSIHIIWEGENRGCLILQRKTLIYILIFLFLFYFLYGEMQSRRRAILSRLILCIPYSRSAEIFIGMQSREERKRPCPDKEGGSKNLMRCRRKRKKMEKTGKWKNSVV